MSRRHPYPVASTSYHAPPQHQSYRAAGSHLQNANNISHDIYIPASQEERNRVGIESRLLQPSGPNYRAEPIMRGDATGASSTFDTYDRIGLEEERGPISGVMDESMIPGVGRGVRNNQPRQASHYEQMRSLKQYPSHMTASSPVRSPYRPGKYRNGYVASSSIRRAYPTLPGAQVDLDAVTATLRSRHARVETESESDNESSTDSADSDGNGNEIASVQSTGNHHGFAATPAGHTLTMTGNVRQRPFLGQETLNRIDFDLNTDTDSDKKKRSKAATTRQRSNSDDPTYTNIQSGTRPVQPHRREHLQQDPTGPFAPPRAANTFGMNAANYQQHLASRTMTSPAVRTMIGDRSKSPDSPTPASTQNIKLSSHQTGRGARDSSAVSAFEDLARRLQRDVELTRRGAAPGNEEVDDGSNSNSGGSGFGPGSQASSARTKVDAPQPAHFNKHGYPAYAKSGLMPSPFAARLPDMTGLTSALGSPIKARVQHLGFDSAVGNQEARLEELANLRYFVEGIQGELDRAGERILSLEETQDLQGQEVQGLRTDMQNAIRDVREQHHASDAQLIELVMQKLQKQTLSQTTAPHARNSSHRPAQATTPHTEPTPIPTRSEQPSTVGHEPFPRTSFNAAAVPVKQHVNAEVVNKLYSELDQLRFAMEEQYKSAAAMYSEEREGSRPSRHTGMHETGRSSSRDPWEAIEALRTQVVHLAYQVEGLNNLVVDKVLYTGPKTHTHSASSSHLRHHFVHDHNRRVRSDGHPASDPVLPYRETTYVRSSSPSPSLRPRKAAPYGNVDRKISFERPQSAHSRMHASVQDDCEDEVDADYDKTIDAESVNRGAHRDHDEHDISRAADARAERASARISQRGQHNPTGCSVCASHSKSDRRKAARKSKMLKAEQRREAVELEESILLNVLDPQHDDDDTLGAFLPSSAAMRIGRAEVKTLHRILAEHWDEFLHQRMLYSELADELKSLSPDMSKTKRKILAHHLLEAVELLELKADRINRLDKVLSACTGTNDNHGFTEKVRKEAGTVNTKLSRDRRPATSRVQA